MPEKFSSPENQPVTFIELFFDLVFVFAVTQLVVFFHHDLTLETGIQVLLIFWLVWWSWTQFTWSLNIGNTRHTLIELMVLIATAVAFFMAIFIPNAFNDQALLFAIAYVTTRLIGFTVYGLVASENKLQLKAVKSFTLASVGGLISVLVGALLGGDLQILFWFLVIPLDLISTEIGGRQEGWNIFPKHFSERHGLFVIIALGETLIVAAGGLNGAIWNFELILVALLSVMIIFSFWWSYFDKTKPVIDSNFEKKIDVDLTKTARNLFSWLHYPLILGVIFYATVIEEAIAHPTQNLSDQYKIIFSLSLILFLSTISISLWRSNTKPLIYLPRLLISITLGGIILIIESQVYVSMAIALIGLIILLVIENITIKEQIT